MIKRNKQGGSALLYTLMLIGSLMLVAGLAFSYIVFSLASRHESYVSQVNYWLAWGGAEAALEQIHNFQPSTSGSAFALLPPNPNNLIEAPRFLMLNAVTGNNFQYTNVNGSGFYSQVSATNFTKISPQKISLATDDSAVFDLSRFNGALKINFYLDMSNPNNNLVWLRLEKPAGNSIIEGVLKVSGSSLILSSDSSSSFPGGTPTVCDVSSPPSTQSCLAMQFNLPRGYYRFAKIKVFGGKADLNFDFNGASLGMPDTTIHAVGQMKTNDPNKKELYIQFPNQLKSISDVLDYSLYQASF